MECDIVQDFLNLNSIDLSDERKSKSNEPELHEYNADEELGACKQAYHYFTISSYLCIAQCAIRHVYEYNKVFLNLCYMD